jgi:hypothetical protein
MFRFYGRLRRLGTLTLLVIVLCSSLTGIASPTQAGSDEIFFSLSPEGNELQFACVGKSTEMFFLAQLIDSGDPLAPLTSQEIRVVNAIPPSVGKLSQRTWTIPARNAKLMRFTYTGSKPGREELVFDAAVLDGGEPASSATVTKSVSFPVVHCRYKVTVHSEILNSQGGISTNIFYDGEGHFDLLPKEKGDPGPGSPIFGTGVAKVEINVDGTASRTTCVTTSPGKGSNNFLISGDGDPNTMFNLTLQFGDIMTSVGQSCNGRAWSIPRIGWLPNSAESGLVKDLQFSPKGDNQELPISAVNDTRYTEGANQGSMLITVLPEDAK